MFLKKKKVTVSQLSNNDKNVLLDELYSIYSQFYREVTKETYYKIMFERDHAQEIALYYDKKNGALVGFIWASCLANINENTLILTAGLCLKKQYPIAHIQILFFMVNFILKVKLSHLSKKKYLFMTTVTPIAYRAISRISQTFYPAHNTTTPQEIMNIVNGYCNAKQISRAEGDFWKIPLESRLINPKNLTRHKESNNPHIQYFLTINPEYAKGYGLITCTPVTYKNIMACIFKQTWHFLKKIMPARFREGYKNAN